MPRADLSGQETVEFGYKSQLSKSASQTPEQHSLFCPQEAPAFLQVSPPELDELPPDVELPPDEPLPLDEPLDVELPPDEPLPLDVELPPDDEPPSTWHMFHDFCTQYLPLLPPLLLVMYWHWSLPLVPQMSPSLRPTAPQLMTHTQSPLSLNVIQWPSGQFLGCPVLSHLRIKSLLLPL